MIESREKRKTWYDKKAVEREVKPSDQVLLLVTNKAHKMSASWMRPGKVTAKISDTNYIFEIPGRREKSQIFHINLLKPYNQRVEKINVLSHECDELEALQDMEIAFPLEEPVNYNFKGIVEDSKLTERCNPDKLQELETLVGEFRESFQITRRRRIWKYTILRI